ncbi:glycosyltransferase [Acidovorax soli]|uniref:Glycosyltransferase like family 2 n=1 Tax=Acidovorax soli TaxID=592050 RepID=A0A1H3VIZ4_9BURK|nr:glycosyltransferase [Acidovorax soli]SDZ74745.1 Glycosyltransferase like family 2 [Acidovorax soli]
MKTKIATLMAVYRGDNPVALVAALESVQGQQFVDNVESRLYVAIDGPVPAAINTVLAEHEKNIYRVVRLERNGGLAAALNVLIKELSDEEFVFRMDADDRSYLGRYQAQLTYFRQHPDIDILGTDIIELNTESGVRRHVSFCRGPDDALARLCRGVPVAHPTVCFRRHVLDRVGGYPQAGSNEDIALWFRCAKEGFRFANVHQPLLEFTVGPNFWSRRSVDKAYGELRIYTKGIWVLHGMTFKYVYPLLRFMLRLAPHWLSRLIYNSSLRRSTRVG